MNKRAEDLHIRLKERVIKPFIFYLPYDKLSVEAKSIVNETPLLKQAFNTIISISEDYEIHINEISIKDLEFTTKKEYLDLNIIALIDLLDNHSPAQFKFIYEKYFELIQGIAYVTDWMYQHFDTYFNSKEYKKRKVLFKFQSDAFLRHAEELKKQFNAYTIKKTTHSNLPDLFKRELSQIKFNTSTHKKSLIFNKERKSEPITAMEAREYLLKTVFNL